MNRLSRNRLRPSPALVVASLALAVSLGGTGYAALKLPASSVGVTQLKRDAVTSLKVKDGSLLKIDFKPGQLRAGRPGSAGAQGAQGPAGQQGPKGDRGEKGDTGSPGVTAAERVQAQTSPSSTSVQVATATCPVDKKVVGGGAWVSGVGGSGGPVLLRSTPDTGLTVWQAVAAETGSFSGNWQVFSIAICAKVAS